MSQQGDTQQNHAVGGTDKGDVRDEQGDVPGEEHLPPADLVRQPARRNGQRQVDGRRAERKHGEVRRFDVQPALQQQVDERVTDCDEPEHHSPRAHPAEGVVPQ